MISGAGSSTYGWPLPAPPGYKGNKSGLQGGSKLSLTQVRSLDRLRRSGRQKSPRSHSCYDRTVRAWRILAARVLQGGEVMSRRHLRTKPRSASLGNEECSATSKGELAVSDLRKEVKPVGKPRRQLTIHDLGWTREQAREVRAKLSTFAVDWDDPGMDIYNEP